MRTEIERTDLENRIAFFILKNPETSRSTRADLEGVGDFF